MGKHELARLTTIRACCVGYNNTRVLYFTVAVQEV